MMYNNYWNSMMGNPQLFWSNFGFALVPLALWGLFWKGWALWKAAKNDSKPWFIALLIINTMGILEILYIFIFGKDKKTSAGKRKK